MKRHRPRPLLLYVIALVLLGVVAWWIVGVLLSILFKLVIAALLIAGAVYLLRRPARRIGGNGPRALRR